MGKPFENKEAHESYGMIGISRWTGNKGGAFFGSPLLHSEGVSIRIYGAELCRELSSDYHFAKEPPLIEVDLTESQLARLLTSANIGNGVPCTIKHFNGKTMEACPFKSETATFQTEFRKDIADVQDKAKQFSEAVQALLTDTRLPKTKQAELQKMADSIVAELTSSMPFVYDQFTKSLAKASYAAKTDFDAYVEHRIRGAGLAAIEAESAPRLPELPMPGGETN